MGNAIASHHVQILDFIELGKPLVNVVPVGKRKGPRNRPINYLRVLVGSLKYFQGFNVFVPSLPVLQITVKSEVLGGRTGNRTQGAILVGPVSSLFGCPPDFKALTFEELFPRTVNGLLAFFKKFVELG